MHATRRGARRAHRCSCVRSQVLTEAYDYLASQPGKGVRSMLVDAFNEWIGAPSEDVEVIKDVVSLLHTSSLLCVLVPRSDASYRDAHALRCQHRRH